MAVQATNLQFDYSKYGFRDEENYVYKSGKGLNEGVVRELSGMKGEPEWMLKRRLQALEIFRKKPVPLVGAWANDKLAELDYDNIHYFVRAGDKPQTDWDAVPAEIKNTFEKLGIPEAERKFLAGVGAQYESEVVYHSLREEWSKLGVIFLDTDTALKEYPEIFKKYFGTIIPAADNKYAALNTAVWSGGSFVYVPKGVHVDIPLQAYFRINAENMGQFERTLIIVEEGADDAPISRAAPRRSTRPTRCTRRWLRSSSTRARSAATPPSKTGRITSSTWSPSARWRMKRPAWSGSTATSARG